jgi:molybdate transport system substrate-binding protein
MTLTVFAAASLTDAFNEIGAAFKSDHPGMDLAFSFGGSQQLAQQIGQGAPADIFASANQAQMDALVKSGQVVSGTQKTFAKNRLIVIFPKDNPGGIRALTDLAKPGLKLVLAAKEAPVGQYALNYLEKAVKDTAFMPSYKDDVLKNVVSYETDVKSVLTKVTLGEADAGIVYASDISIGAGGQVSKLDIPDALNVIATYPIAVLKGSKNAKAANDFMDFVLSGDGQAILAKYGFIPLSGK